MFENGKVWLNDAGVPIQAHGGCIIPHGGMWYWYGEHKGEKIHLLAVAVYRALYGQDRTVVITGAFRNIYIPGNGADHERYHRPCHGGKRLSQAVFWVCGTVNGDAGGNGSIVITFNNGDRAVLLRDPETDL